MEHLSLHDAGQHGPPPMQQTQQMQQMQPPIPQLPPQMFTTAAQLLDLTDSALREAHGSFERWQKAHRRPSKLGPVRYEEHGMAQRKTTETFKAIWYYRTLSKRLFVEGLYADVDRGLFMVRGENVTLLGEIDLDKDDFAPPGYEVGSVEKVFALKKREDIKQKKLETSRQKKLAAIGFEAEHQGEAIL